MKLRDHYDWIVLGEHPGALLSASLVARLGLSVLVLPLAPIAKLIISRGGQLLDPESNYALGMTRSSDQNGLLLEALGRCGILPAEMFSIQGERSFPQVLTPENRFVLARGKELPIELQREFGKDRAKALALAPALKQVESDFLSFWLKFPQRLTVSPDKKQRNRGVPLDLPALRKVLLKENAAAEPAQKEWLSSRHTPSRLGEALGIPEFGAIAAGLWHGITASTDQEPTLSALIHAFSLSRTGASYKGGMTAYRDFLLRMARRLGADIPAKTECKRIFIERGRFVGVQVTHRSSVVVGTGGALGTSIARSKPQIESNGRGWFRGLRKGLAPSGWKFTIALTARAEAVSPGIMGRAIWQEEKAPPLEIEVVDPTDCGIHEPQNRIIYLRTVLPFKPESLELAYQKVTAARMLRQAFEVFPFLDSHLVRIYPDFRSGMEQKFTLVPSQASPQASGSESSQTQTNDEVAELYSFPSLETIPDNLLVYPGKGLGSRSGVEGLFLVSGESYPEFGSLGGTVAAIESVAWLAHRSGLSGPFA